MAQADGPTSNADSKDYVSLACLDFLLIEMVPQAYRLELTKHLDNHEATISGDSKWTDLTEEQKDKFVSDCLGVGDIGGGEPVMDPEELRQRVMHRLDTQGARVGQMLAERCTRDMPRFQDNLERMKFICKDLWTVLYQKQVDNLKTNHRGTFVLTDNMFTPLRRASLERGRDPMTMMTQAQSFHFYHSGIVRGALEALGMKTTVQAESTELPGVTFQIRTVGANP